MEQAEFRREYLGEWPEPTPWEQIAEYCWLLYFWKTERYDRAVCRPPQQFKYGEVIPRFPEERELCTDFARRVQREVLLLSYRLAGLLGLDREVSKEEWYSARSAAQRIPFEQLETQLARHPMGEQIEALRR